MNLSKEAKLVRVMNAVAAGQTAQNSSSVDMKDFRACQFTALFGTIAATAVTSIKAQGSDDDSTWSDLTGTSVLLADDDDNQIAAVDIVNPQHRYLRLVISRGTADATIVGVIAQLYQAIDAPVVHDSATVASVEFHAQPIAGTA